MGDGRAVAMSAKTAGVGGTKASASAAPRVTARRNTRFNTRSAIRSFQVERAPIILEFGSTVLRAGYAEQFQPQHLISIEVDEDDDPVGNVNIKNNNKSEAQWYACLSPLIQQAYDRLMCNPTSRRVVIVHRLYSPKAWETALKQIFWNKGVPAVAFLCSLEILPVAQGWKRGLIVQISYDEAVCVCHADGHILPFTFQSVPDCGYKNLVKDSTKLQKDWTSKMNQLLLDENNPNSLIVALMKCLELCPRDVRFYVVSNLVFFGDGVLLIPDLGRQVAKRLQDFLEGTATKLEFPEEESSASISSNLMTVVPVASNSLKPLADRVGLTSCAPHRPDFISWVAASLWAATWNKYDDEETKIMWQVKPAD